MAVNYVVRAGVRVLVRPRTATSYRPYVTKKETVFKSTQHCDEKGYYRFSKDGCSMLVFAENIELRRVEKTSKKADVKVSVKPDHVAEHDWRRDSEKS